MESVGRIDFERRTQLAFDFGVVGGSRASACNDHHITRRPDPIVVPAEELADETLDPVAHDRAAHPPAGGDSNP